MSLSEKRNFKINYIPSNGVINLSELDLYTGHIFKSLQLQVKYGTKEVDISKGIENYTSKNMYGVELTGFSVDNKIFITVAKDDVSKLKEYLTTTDNRNFVLFVNGYDLAKAETNNEVWDHDKLDYWGTIDDSFVNSINKNSHVIYADGNKDISTSNHLNVFAFNASRESFSGNQYGYYPYLNTTPNVAGFNERVRQGKIAGEDFIKKIKENKITCNKTMINGKLTLKNPIDIVCHSMGFAYSLGMIEVLQKEGITIGNYYVIAPENAESGTIPAGLNTVWQYGSDEKEPINKQDGVAPQKAAKNLDIYIRAEKGGRAYIPTDGSVPRGFLESHTIKNYGWIFKKQSTQKGYVVPRN